LSKIARINPIIRYNRDNEEVNEMEKLFHKNAIHVRKIELIVKDLKRSIEFYTSQLGFQLIDETERFVSLGVNGDEILRLFENKEAKPIDKTLGIYHFAILLPNRKALSRFLKHCIAKQIPITGAADHLVSEAIYLLDPDGIGIEITADRNQEFWNPEKQSVPMGTLPFDYTGVYYETLEEGDSFTQLPEDTILGHLHLQVKDLSSSSQFYEKSLGFQITSKDFQGAVFMSDEHYHHHIALNSWMTGKYIAHTDDSIGMKSFSIEYPTCEKLISALEHIKEANIEIKETIEGYLIRDMDKNAVYLDIKHSDY